MKKIGNSFCKKCCLLFMVFIIIISGVSCSSINKSAKSGEAKEDSSPKIYNIGDEIKVDGYKVVVNGVRTATSDSSGLLKASEGNEYFLVNVTLENTSDKDKHVSSIMMFKVVDQNGKSYDQSIFTDAEGQLDGTIAPTRKMTGEYCVEVPQGTTGLELEFEDLGSKPVIVKLN